MLVGGGAAGRHGRTFDFGLLASRQPKQPSVGSCAHEMFGDLYYSSSVENIAVLNEMLGRCINRGSKYMTSRKSSMIKILRYGRLRK